MTPWRRNKHEDDNKWRHRNRPFAAGSPFVGLAIAATAGAIVAVVPASSAYAASTLQVTNLQSTCGSPGFNGHGDATGTPNDTDQFVIQAQLADTTNYPDDFHGSITPSGGEFHGTVDWQNPIGWEQNPPTTDMAVQFDLYDYTTSAHLASFSTTLPACTTANSPPMANAGPDVSGYINRAIQLDASGSSDPDGDALTYAWSYPSGTPCTFSDTTIARPTTTCTAAGGYTATVTVGDASHPAASSDTVTVTATEVPPPTAADFRVVVTRSLTTPPLDVTTSATNPCGGTLTVQITKAPSLGTATVSNNKIVYQASSEIGPDHLTYVLTDACGHASNLATVNYEVRYPPLFTPSVINASPHQANGGLSFIIVNRMEGRTASESAGPDDYQVCITSPLPQVCKVRSGVPDGQLTTVTITGYKENQTVHYAVALVGDPAKSGSELIGVRAVVKFTASIAKYAVKTGVHRGRAKVRLLNYWSGRSVLIYVRDGFGTWHKYIVAKEKNVTVYVPTPRGTHKVTVYRYYSGAKHRVTYRYVIR